MSWNATVDRLRARAQHDALTDDELTRRLLYEAVDEITRMATALDVSEEQRAERERVLGPEIERLERRIPNPDDLRVVLSGRVTAHDPGMVALWWAAYDRVRATLEERNEHPG